MTDHSSDTTTWFITGASRGLGRALARAALERGDRVAATARDVTALSDLAREHPRLVPIALDVDDGAAVTRAVHEAQDRLGHLDVVVNNAGYGHFGAVEEVTDTELRNQLETNVLGPHRVVRAVLPGMRARGRGHVVQVSSIGGIGAFADLGAYHASKWALEALGESLASEVARFGIHVTLAEPGAYDTDWAGPSARHSSALRPYDAMRQEAAGRRGLQAPGDPDAAARALLTVVDSPQPPLRVLLGATAPGIVRGIYERRLAQWQEWESLALEAQGILRPDAQDAVPA